MNCFLDVVRWRVSSAASGLSSRWRVISEICLTSLFMGETNYLIYLFMFTMCLRMCCIIKRCVAYSDNGIALFSASFSLEQIFSF